jgi:hypothetical protein
MDTALNPVQVLLCLKAVLTLHFATFWLGITATVFQIGMIMKWLGRKKTTADS